jgi:hypothetical protein
MIAAASAVVFVATATGSALAWNGSVEQLGATPQASAPAQQASTGDAPATRATVAPAVRPAAAVKVTTTSTTAAKATAKAVAPKAATKAKTATAKKTATKPATTARVAAKSITISRYVDAPGSQAQIDKCKLVLWTKSPLWLAGHNWCGYQWMAFVKTGTTVKVTSGAAAGTYVVTGHLKLTRQSGSLPKLNADLVLQTCVGSGTGLTLLRRV